MAKKTQTSDEFNFAVSRALLIRPPWSGLILRGDEESGRRKTRQMRTAGTKLRGWFELIESKTGEICGLMKVTDSTGPHSEKELIAMRDAHFVPPETIRDPNYKWRHAWHIGEVLPLHKPVPYDHPSGAVIWVKLSEKDVAALEKTCRETLDMLDKSAKTGADKKRAARLRTELGIGA